MNEFICPSYAPQITYLLLRHQVKLSKKPNVVISSGSWPTIVRRRQRHCQALKESSSSFSSVETMKATHIDERRRDHVSDNYARVDYIIIVSRPRRHRKVGSVCLFLLTTNSPSPIPSFGHPPSCTMLIMLVAFLVAAFAVLCIRVPSVWLALVAADDLSDARELSLVVASRAFHLPLPPLSLSAFHEALTPAPFAPRHPTGNPFRESGPPACMAKLIMMRHKVTRSYPRSALPARILTPRFGPQLNQANTRRRRTSAPAPRPAPRQFTLPAPRLRAAPWIRMPKHFGLQHH
jgi:hypothetical protein